jgi:hypothetical protein
MITIDQAKIDAPKFPRSQEWWAGFAPVWIAAAVQPDGTVTLEPSGRMYDYANDSDEIITVPLSPAARRRQEAAMARWVGNLPRLAVAIVA